MKKILLILLPILLNIVACSSGEDHKDKLYYGMTMKIVAVQGPYEWRSGKYSSDNKQWLLQDINDTIHYCIWDVRDDSTFFNHQVGDIVKFDYIRKDRFFIINPR